VTNGDQVLILDYDTTIRTKAILALPVARPFAGRRASHLAFRDTLLADAYLCDQYSALDHEVFGVIGLAIFPTRKWFGSNPLDGNV
jgi:hypothetical protein